LSIDFKNAVTLKTGSGVREGHCKCHHSMRIFTKSVNLAQNRVLFAADGSGRRYTPELVCPTGRSDDRIVYVNASFDWSDRSTVGTIQTCLISFNCRSDCRSICGHYVRLVGPTSQSDDQSSCSVGGTCCLRHSYIAAAVIYTKTVLHF